MGNRNCERELQRLRDGLAVAKAELEALVGKEDELPTDWQDGILHALSVFRGHFLFDHIENPDKELAELFGNGAEGEA